MKRFLMLIFLLTSIIVSAQNGVHAYRNETFFLFFHESNVIYLNAASEPCMVEDDSFRISMKTYRKCLRKFRKKTKLFKKGQVTATDIYGLFFTKSQVDTVNFTTIEKQLDGHYPYLDSYLERKGFTLINMLYYEDEDGYYDVQFYIGSQVSCEFYNLKIWKNKRRNRLEKGDYGLIMIRE